MTTQYPDGIDTNVQIPLSTDNITQVAAIVTNTLRGAIIAVEQELGIQPSREFSTVRARLDAMQGIIDALSGGGGSSGAPITNIAPVDVTKSAAFVGNIQEAARSDHKHSIGTSSATSISNINSEGSSTFLARADHTHSVIGLNISGQVKGSILYFDGTSWVQLSPSTDGLILTTHGAGANPTWTASSGTALTNIAPINVTKAAAVVGVGTTAARNDHKHDISTAATISIANANSEGVATTLARSDHLHALAGNVGGDLSGTLPNPTVTNFHIGGATSGAVLYYNGTNWIVLNAGQDGYVLTTHSTGFAPSWGSLPSGIALAVVAPNDVDKSAAVVGVSARAAHEDHKHNIVTAAAVSIGATNAEGVATSLARSDHTHQVTDLHLTSQAQGSVIYFNGTNWVILPPTTAGNVLTTNGASANPTWTALPAGLSLATVAPVNIDKAAAVLGVSTRAAKEDHKHSANTASAISVGTVNAEGTATTLARSDHTHIVSGLAIASQTTGDLLVFNGTIWTRLPDGTAGLILTANGAGSMPTYQAAPTGVTLSSTTPANVNAGAGTVGVGTTAARSDHVHQVDTATPVSIGASNVLGVATSLAKSDHQHLVQDLHMTSQVQGNVLYFSGTNWVVLANGTAGQVLTTNGASANPNWTSVIALSSVAPVNVDGTVAAVGVATTAARSDHHHNVNFGIPVSIGATNAQGVATTLARSDHLHAVQDLNIAGETRGDVIFYNGTNWVRLPAGQDGYVLTTHSTIANPTWNIVSGGGGSPVSSVFTRTGAIVAVSGDYTSTLITNSSSVTGANVTIALNNLQNSINSLPVVSLSNVAPVNVNALTAAVGVATTAARSDHKHNIDVGVPVSIGTANAAGTATTLARSDHQHSVTGLVIASQAQGDVLYFNGTSWVILAPGTTGQALTTQGVAANPIWSSVVSLTAVAPANVDGVAAAVGVATTAARSDHKHNVNFGTAVSVGTANSAGTATTLARSDHTHIVSGLSIASQATGTSLVFNGTSWVVLAPAASGTVLVSNGASAIPSFQSLTSAQVSDSSTALGATVLASFNNVITKINNLDSLNISNSSSVTGATVFDVSNNLLNEYPNGGYTISASFTLSNGNRGKLGAVTVSASFGSLVCTINPAASSGIPVGAKFTILLYASGSTCAFVGTGGIVLHSTIGLFSSPQYTKINLECVATDEWTITEDHVGPSSNLAFNLSTAIGFTITDALSYLNSKSFNGSVTQSLAAVTFDPTWTFFPTQGWVGGANNGTITFAILPPPNGTTITAISLGYKPTIHSQLPVNMPQMIFWAANAGANATAVQTVIDTSATVAIYNAFHSIFMLGLSIAAGRPCWLEFQDEGGTHSAAGLQIYQIAVTYS